MSTNENLNVLTADGDGSTALPRSGYDHDWFDFSPLPSRRAVEWPGDYRTAASIVIELSAAEWEDEDTVRPRPEGGRGLGVPPDVPRMSHREFGHRVGIFRLLEILEEYDLRPAISLDALTIEHYPVLVDHVLPGAAEIICGGLSASRPLTSEMTLEEEKHYISAALNCVSNRIGTRPDGWLSPNRSESQRTPMLLAEAGFRFVADWANDDISFPFTGLATGLWAYPLSWELSDLATAYMRAVSPEDWADSAIEAFDVINEEGGRIFNLHLDPWLSGQAFRAAALERVIKHISASKDAWIAPPGDVVAHCQEWMAP